MRSPRQGRTFTVHLSKTTGFEFLSEKEHPTRFDIAKFRRESTFPGILKLFRTFAFGSVPAGNQKKIGRRREKQKSNFRLRKKVFVENELLQREDVRFPGIESDQADERDGGVSVQCTTDTDAIDEIKNKKSLTAIRQTSGDFWRAFHCVEAPQVAPHEAPEAGPRSTHKERRNARRGHSSAASFSKKVSPPEAQSMDPEMSQTVP